MKEFETVENNEYVPQDADVLGCLRVAQSLPVASSALAGEVYFLNGNQEGYTRSHTYRCELDPKSGVYTWVDQNLGRYAVGNCKNIKFRTLEDGDGLRVIIAWEDPDDEAVGTEKVIWARTRLVWRRGRMPESVVDGNVETSIESTVRNSRSLFGPTHFTIPNYDPDATYYFKLFPITTDNVVTCDDLNGRCSSHNYVPTTDQHPWYKDGDNFLYNRYYKRVYDAVTNTYSYVVLALTDRDYFEWVVDGLGSRYEFVSGVIHYEYNSASINWAAVRDVVSSGAGETLFPVGTVFTLPYHSDFGEMDFQVVSHNTEDLADKTKKYSMTLGALHAPQWWDRVKDDSKWGSAMSYDYGITHLIDNGSYLSGSTEYSVAYYNKSQMVRRTKSNPNGVQNYDKAALSEFGHSRAEQDGRFWYKLLVEEMRDSGWTPGVSSPTDPYALFTSGDYMGRWGDDDQHRSTHTGSVTDTPYKTRYDKTSNAWSCGPMVGPSSIPGTALFVSTNYNVPKEDSYAMKIIRQQEAADTTTASKLAACAAVWGDEIVYDTADDFPVYIPNGWDQRKIFFPSIDQNDPETQMMIPIDGFADGPNNWGDHQDRMRYTTKYFIPIEPLIQRKLAAPTMPGAKPKAMGDLLQNVMLITPSMEKYATMLRKYTTELTIVPERYADTWFRRYHTYPNSTYPKDSGAGNWWEVSPRQLLRDLIRIPTQDEVYLNHKRYWKKTYQPSTYHIVPSDVGVYAQVDTSRTYTDVAGKERNYMRRSKVPETTSGSVYEAVYRRMFSAVYTLNATRVTTARTATAPTAVYTLDTSWGGGGGPKGGPCLRYKRVIIQKGGRIDTNYYEIEATKVTSGVWEKGGVYHTESSTFVEGTVYFEFVDNEFVQLRSNKRYYTAQDAGSSWLEQSTTEEYCYDYIEGEKIADYLYTPGERIPILNDVPRLVRKGSNYVWTYADGNSLTVHHNGSTITFSDTIAKKDCWGNKRSDGTLADNKIPTAFEGEGKYAYRLHGYPTNTSSNNAWDVVEICEGAVTSYDIGPVDDLAAQQFSGEVVQAYWKSVNMSRIAYGDERWPTSCLRQYLNGPFDPQGRALGVKCDTDDPSRYFDFGASPVQQYVYDYTVHIWKERYTSDEFWYHPMSAMHYIDKNKSITFQPYPGYSYMSGIIGHGDADDDTPKITYKFMRDIEGIDKVDLHNTLTPEIALPRQSFLHGFIDCQYKRTNDANADPNKDYYHKNSYGLYEKLNSGDVYVRGGPFAHCLYEYNPNFRKDLLEAVDFLNSILLVNTRTQLRDPNRGGTFNSYEEFEHTHDYSTTVDKVWVASADQVLAMTGRSTDKGEFQEGHGLLYGTDRPGYDVDDAMLKYLVRYDYHGVVRYENKYAREDGQSYIRTLTRTSEAGHYGELLTVKWDHGSRTKSRAAEIIRPRDNFQFLPMLCIG